MSDDKDQLIAELVAALDECDTAFAVLNIGRDHGVTPQADAAMREAWIKVWRAMHRATGRKEYAQHAEAMANRQKL